MALRKSPRLLLLCLCTMHMIEIDSERVPKSQKGHGKQRVTTVEIVYGSTRQLHCPESVISGTKYVLKKEGVVLKSMNQSFSYDLFATDVLDAGDYECSVDEVSSSLYKVVVRPHSRESTSKSANNTGGNATGSSFMHKQRDRGRVELDCCPTDGCEGGCHTIWTPRIARVSQACKALVDPSKLSMHNSIDCVTMTNSGKNLLNRTIPVTSLRQAVAPIMSELLFTDTGFVLKIIPLLRRAKDAKQNSAVKCEKNNVNPKAYAFNSTTIFVSGLKKLSEQQCEVFETNVTGRGPNTSFTFKLAESNLKITGYSTTQDAVKLTYICFGEITKYLKFAYVVTNKDGNYTSYQFQSDGSGEIRIKKTLGDGIYSIHLEVDDGTIKNLSNSIVFLSLPEDREFFEDVQLYEYNSRTAKLKISVPHYMNFFNTRIKISLFDSNADFQQMMGDHSFDVVAKTPSSIFVGEMQPLLVTVPLPRMFTVLSFQVEILERDSNVTKVWHETPKIYFGKFKPYRYRSLAFYLVSGSSVTVSVKASEIPKEEVVGYKFKIITKYKTYKYNFDKSTTTLEVKLPLETVLEYEVECHLRDEVVILPTINQLKYTRKGVTVLIYGSLIAVGVSITLVMLAAVNFRKFMDIPIKYLATTKRVRKPEKPIPPTNENQKVAV